MTQLPNLNHVSHGQKDALIRTLWEQVQTLSARVTELEARLGGPPKNSDNSSQPPSRDQKHSQADKPKREGPRKGGSRLLAENPDEILIARPKCCAQCQAAFADADYKLVGRDDEIELPKVKPVVTRVKHYAGWCYLRATHTISYKRMTRLMLKLFGLAISEGTLDAAFRRAMPRLDAEVSAILARLRRVRVVCSDETSVRVDGRTCWNWVFQNSEVVIHVVRQPQRRRGRRGDGRPPPGAVGVRPLQRPAGEHDHAV